LNIFCSSIKKKLWILFKGSSQIDPSTLARGWRDFADYSICQVVGNDWYDKGLSLVLKVPSAVLTTNCNYVFNSVHPDFKLIKLIDTSDLIPDDRIEDLLKRYAAK
jgi:RES domain-containing protein